MQGLLDYMNGVPVYLPTTLNTAPEYTLEELHNAELNSNSVDDQLIIQKMIINKMAGFQLYEVPFITIPDKTEGKSASAWGDTQQSSGLKYVVNSSSNNSTDGTSFSITTEVASSTGVEPSELEPESATEVLENTTPEDSLISPDNIEPKPEDLIMIYETTAMETEGTSVEEITSNMCDCDTSAAANAMNNKEPLNQSVITR